MSERSVPYYCPYCAGEDLRPYEDRHGAWECRSCTRVFALSFVGLRINPDPAPVAGQSTADSKGS